MYVYFEEERLEELSEYLVIGLMEIIGLEKCSSTGIYNESVGGREEGKKEGRKPRKGNYESLKFKLKSAICYQLNYHETIFS